MATPSDTRRPDDSDEEPHSYGEDLRNSSYEDEDRRWKRQWTDWILLAVMIAISLGYHIAIYLVQPGLR